MEKVHNRAIELSAAASVIDALLAAGGYGKCDEIRELLSSLRGDESTRILDFSRRLISVLLDIVRDTYSELVQRVAASLEPACQPNENFEEQLRSEVTLAEIHRVSAVRLLGILSDLQAEGALRHLALDRTEPLSTRIIALRVLMAVDASKGLQAARDLLEGPVREIAVVSRVVFADTGATVIVGGEAEGDLVIRECLDLLGSVDNEPSRALLVKAMQRKDLPLVLRQLAFDLVHRGDSLGDPTTFHIVKIVTCLK